MEQRRDLSDLTSYTNVNGDKVAGRRVVEERTQLERTEVEDERQADILLLRRYRRLGLDKEGAHLFTRFYWSIMINEENAFRHRRQKR